MVETSIPLDTWTPEFQATAVDQRHCSALPP